MSAQKPISNDSFNCRKTLNVDGKSYVYYSLPEAEANGLTGISKLPYSMKVLLENLLRHEDGRSVTKADIEAMAQWLDNKGKTEKEIGFRPARVLMQDFTGVPAVVDLAAMRDGMMKLGGDPTKINPLVPVDLVIDHSVQVDEFGTPNSFREQRRARIRAQRRALRISASGARRRSTISASCRPAPASAIRSISNIWRRRSGLSHDSRRRTRRLSRYARRHRQPHDDGQRPRRARLGRRRHRGRSGDARPADVDAASRKSSASS